MQFECNLMTRAEKRYLQCDDVTSPQPAWPKSRSHITEDRCGHAIIAKNTFGVTRLVFIKCSFSFYIYLAMPRGWQDLSAIIRDWTQASSSRIKSPNHWTARAFSIKHFSNLPWILENNKKTFLTLILTFVSVRAQLCLFATPRTVDCQAPLSLGFSRQEYWSGLPHPPPGGFPDPGMEPGFPVAPALAGGFLKHWATGASPTFLRVMGYCRILVYAS